jgi:hypothetical protein
MYRSMPFPILEPPPCAYALQPPHVRERSGRPSPTAVAPPLSRSRRRFDTADIRSCPGSSRPTRGRRAVR